MRCIMSRFNRMLCLSASFIVLNAASDVLAYPDIESLNPTLTSHSTELKPAHSFLLARAVFLPETKDDLGFSGRDTGGTDFNKGDPCKDFNIYTCPANGKCTPCLTNPNKKRLDSCSSPYVISGQACVCPPTVALNYPNDKCNLYCGNNCIKKTCEKSADQTGCTNSTQACDDGCGGTTRKCCVPCTDKITTKPENSNYTYTTCADGDGSHQIQDNWSCISGYHTKDNGCEKDCNATSCSGYTLDSCPEHGVCDKCTKTALDCSTDGTKYKLSSCENGYKISGSICIESKNTVDLPIIYSDGKISKEIFSDKTPIAIVYDEERKLALALEDDSYIGWSGNFDIPNLPNSSPEYNLTYGFVEWGGKEHTKIIVDYCKNNNKNCPAAEYAYQYSTVGTNPGDWFLGSTGELQILAQKKDILNPILSKLKGDEIGGYSCSYYWSSSEVDYDIAWYVNLGSGGYIGGMWKTTGQWFCVRPIIDYSQINPNKTALPILYSDMSIANEVIAGKTPIGIIFDETNKLAVGLNMAKDLWSTTGFDIPALQDYPTNGTNDTNGKSNTQIIINYCKANSLSCPAAEYVYNYTTAGTSAGQWFLPSMFELLKMYKQRSLINSTFNKIENKTFTALNSEVWSSTENGKMAWYIYFNDNGTQFKEYKNDKYFGKNYILPVINYK